MLRKQPCLPQPSPMPSGVAILMGVCLCRCADFVQGARGGGCGPESGDPLVTMPVWMENWAAGRLLPVVEQAWPLEISGEQGP